MGNGFVTDPNCLWGRVKTVKHLQETCLARSEEIAETVMFSDGPLRSPQSDQCGLLGDTKRCIDLLTSI